MFTIQDQVLHFKKWLALSYPWWSSLEVGFWFGRDGNDGHLTLNSDSWFRLFLRKPTVFVDSICRPLLTAGPNFTPAFQYVRQRRLRKVKAEPFDEDDLEEMELWTSVCNAQIVHMWMNLNLFVILVLYICSDSCFAPLELSFFFFRLLRVSAQVHEMIIFFHVQQKDCGKYVLFFLM